MIGFRAVRDYLLYGVAGIVGMISLAAGCGQSDAGGGGQSDGGTPDLAPALHHRGPARADVAAGFDGMHGKVAVFGGDDGPEVAATLRPHYHDDTWIYDLASGDWSLSAAKGPSERGRTAFAMLPNGQLLVALGRTRAANAPKNTSYTLLGDAWAYDVATDKWRMLSTQSMPPGRSAPVAVWDAAGARMVMFGGNLGTSADVLAGFLPTDETWQLKNTAMNGGAEMWVWSKVKTLGPTPPARYLAAGALDERRNRLIVASGCCDNMGGFMSDAWALDLGTNTWSQLGGNGDGPSNRLGAMAAYDRAGDRVILFGGHDDGSLGNVNDTWALSLAGPPAWQALAMGDAEDNTVLGCGGNKTEQPFNFTKPDLLSPERRERAMLLSIGAPGVLLFGGEGDCAQLDDTWSYLGATWTPRIKAAQGDSCLRRGEQCACLCN